MYGKNNHWINRQSWRLLANLWCMFTRESFYALGWVRASMLGVQLGRGARISPRARLDRVAFLGGVQVGSDVTIGEGSYINSGIIASGQIGSFCSVAYGVLVGPTEHRLDHWTMSPFEAKAAGGQPGSTTREVPPPVIGNGVWVGAHAVILRGVSIGDCAVVAAGAVVTRNIPAYEIWGGVPARRIGSRSVARDVTDV